LKHAFGPAAVAVALTADIISKVWARRFRAIPIDF
jgi:hypothetical protein